MDEQVFLIDCGEGTQMQVFRHRVRVDHCRHIFISHLHGDHVFGLFGLLTTWSLKKRSEALHIYSPPGLQEAVETVVRCCGVRLSYEICFHTVDTEVSQRVFENERLEVWTIPLNHRGPTAGWLFREKTKLRPILSEKIETYAIPYEQIPAIKAGADFLLPDGRRVPNEELTLPPPRPRSYAFCSDTAFSASVADVVKGVDLLYHEATFVEAHAEEAALSYHSTAAQAAEIARLAGAGRLLLGHISGRYADVAQHLAEAKAVFEHVEVAEEGRREVVGRGVA